jgi:hypothetical protein
MTSKKYLEVELLANDFRLSSTHYIEVELTEFLQQAKLIIDQFSGTNSIPLVEEMFEDLIQEHYSNCIGHYFRTLGLKSFGYKDYKIIKVDDIKPLPLKLSSVYQDGIVYAAAYDDGHGTIELQSFISNNKDVVIDKISQQMPWSYDNLRVVELVLKDNQEVMKSNEVI